MNFRTWPVKSTQTLIRIDTLETRHGPQFGWLRRSKIWCVAGISK
jgi:hypothetical protein